MDLNFDEAYKLPMAVLKIIGGHPDIVKDWSWALRFFVGNGLFTLATGLYFFTFIDQLKAGKILDACITMGLILTYGGTTSHYAILFVYKSQFKTMFNTMKKDFEMAKTFSPNERRIVAEYAVKSQWPSKYMFVTVTLIFLTSIIQPILFMLYYSIFDEFKYEYGFEISIPPAFEEYKNTLTVFLISFFIFVYFIFCVTLTYMGMPLIPSITTIHATGQIELIRTRVLQLFPKDESISMEERIQKLRKIAVQSQKVYDFVDLINQIFKIVFEVGLKGTALIMPIYIFQNLEIYKRGHARLEFTIPLLSGACGVIFMICYYGDKLKQKGDDLLFALYSCGWESRYERRVRSTLLIMMIRTTKSIALRTVFDVISLESFAQVVHHAYVLFNLFNTLWR